MGGKKSKPIDTFDPKKTFQGETYDVDCGLFSKPHVNKCSIKYQNNRLLWSFSFNNIFKFIFCYTGKPTLTQDTHDLVIDFYEKGVVRIINGAHLYTSINKYYNQYR